MTKAEAYEKAWRLGWKSGDFSLVDQIYHPDYRSLDYRTGIEANLEDDKIITSTLIESMIVGPFDVMYENEDFVCLESFAKQRLNTTEFEYYASVTGIKYKDGKIIRQKTGSHTLDFDPSEHLDWNWEDFE